MKNIHICPIKSILHELNDRSIGFILCTSDDSLTITQQENILLLRFSDVVDSKRRDAFKLYQAVLVRDFFRMNPNYEDFFVCCDSGESRSPAIAAALMCAAGESDLEIWKNPEYHPNPHVYTVMCRALGVEVDPWSTMPTCADSLFAIGTSGKRIMAQMGHMVFESYCMNMMIHTRSTPFMLMSKRQD